MLRRHLPRLALLATTLFSGTPALLGSAIRAQSPLDVARIRPDIEVGFGHAGWNLDRYRDLDTLAAGKSMVVAEIEGPAVIRHIHTTRHHSPRGTRDIFARGIVIEVYYNGEKTPSVSCPLADFFGDGCNGRSENFTSEFIELAPWSYNAYFTMPFEKSARVILRNDTKYNALNYSYVEWETLPEWTEDLGYFCATYRRDAYQMSLNMNRELFRVEGQGHLLGRQMSWTCDHPVFAVGNDASMAFLMEGNNEVEIDHRKRAIDYLGTEDSFTFSWGFRRRFAGRHAGISLIARRDHDAEEFGEQYLSVYRFHSHMPLRFRQQLGWTLNYEFDHGPHRPWFGEKIINEFGPDEGWVNICSVFYWYQSRPAVTLHEPLLPPHERVKNLIRRPL